MNKYQTALNEIKKALGLAEEVKVELGEVKMVDGTTIKYDKLEVGGALTIVAEDGTEAPVPAGSYELENGFVAIVDEQGIITEYSEKKDEPNPEDEVAATTEETLAEETAAVEVDMATVITDLTARIEALETALAESIGLSKSIVESTQELSKKVEMSTTATPISKVNMTNATAQSNELFDDRIKRLTQTLKELKK